MVSLQKKNRPQVFELGITRCSKTRYIPSYQGWIRELSRRKEVTEAGERETETETEE